METKPTDAQVDQCAVIPDHMTCEEWDAHVGDDWRERAKRIGGETMVQGILYSIGENPKRDGLKDTPARVVRSWETLFGGYKQDPAKILERRFKSDYNQMIVVKDIELFSTCEHHMLPFFGKAHVAYLPSDAGQIVGLSKIARLVECFARRLQIQERLTEQIADAIVKHLDVRGVGVIVEAKHMCMVARGVQKQNAAMVTSALRGEFLSGGIKDEFLKVIGVGK